MKEENEKQSFKTVEPKSGFRGKFEPKGSRLIAKKGLFFSKGDTRWSVKTGDDVTDLDEGKLAVLKNNGVI